MTDLSTILLDPDLGASSFTILRREFRRIKGETTETTLRIPTAGCIHPGTPELVQLLPAEQRADAFIRITTPSRLQTGEEESSGRTFSVPDRILWHNQIWKVVHVRDWSQFNYCEALAVRLKGEEA